MKKGFTLMEFVIVIAIVAILAGIAAVGAFKSIEKGKISQTVGDFRAIKTGLISYYRDVGRWPANSSNGSDFIANNSSRARWDGPYVDKWPPIAAWGGNYTFNSTASYRNLTVSLVEADAAAKIDAQIDDGNNTSGMVTHSGTTLIFHSTVQ